MIVSLKSDQPLPVAFSADDLHVTSRLQQRALIIVQGISLFVSIVGVLVLFGWHFDVAWLKSGLPNAVTMKPNTALCFVLSGISLWFLASRDVPGKNGVWVGRACAMLVALIATLTLAEYLFGFNAHIDSALFLDVSGDPRVSHVGRMAPATAVAFLLTGIALILMRSHRGWSLALAQSAAIITLLIGLIAILGYLYGVNQLHQFYTYSSVAPHSAVLLTVVGAGVVLARVDYGLAAMMTSSDSGGFLARRIFPAAVLLPFIIGWLRLKGEYAGYYEVAFGVALLTTANITIFVGLIWLTARALNRKDAEQRSVQEALQQSGERLRNIVDGLGPSMFVGLLDLDGAVLEANQQALVAAGLTREDVLNKPVEETYWFSYSEASKQQMRDMIARGVRGEASRCDLKIRATENQYIDLDFSMQPFRDASGKVTLLVPSAIVISERKQAGDALRASQQTLHLTLDAAHIGYWDLDLVTHVATRSLMHDQIFGYNTPPEWSYEIFLTHVHPDDRAHVDKLFKEGVETKTLWDFECRIIHLDGEMRWIWGHGNVFTNAAGEAVRMLGMVSDISLRKSAEKALQESEERLRLALDAAHMGTFDWDVPHNRITWSRWHEELWGFQPGEFDGTYKAFSARVHPDDLPGIDAEVARCIAAHEPFVREFRVVWPDGSTHWIASHGEFTFDADGKASRMHGVVREITALKRAEILLGGEKKVLEMMAEGAPLRVILETITRNVEAHSSDTLCSILLLDAEGVRLQHGAAPSLPEGYNSAIHGATIGPKAGSCGTAAYRNQPVIVTDIATDPLWDDYRALALLYGLRACWSTPIRSASGKVLGSFAMYYRAPRAPAPADLELIARVTHLSAIAIERRGAEQALQESEERLRLALEAAHMGTFDWDIPNNRITWSYWHEALWGFMPGEFGGTYEAFSERIHPDDLGTIDAQIAHCIAERQPYEGEFRVVWPDGSVHWISGRGEFTFGVDNQPQRMRGAVVEITERKQAEAALLDAKENLEHKVIERTAELHAVQLELHAKNEELIKQNRRVEEASRLKSEFLANMSHELRTPLNAIIGFSELMHDGKVGPIASNHKEYLGDVLTSAQHLLHLINDVLDLAKVESGKMEFHYAPMDLRKVIGEVCEILRTMTSCTRIQVAIDIDKELSEVWGDASKLKQVLYNYLSNALKFSPEGGQVRVQARCEGRDMYRIEVEDQGIGIKSEDISRLFQEFQQLDLSASKKYQGTGLGLALTKRIIEAQGGRVGVESIRGHGSLFYAVLPLRNAVTESALSLSAPSV